jgi:hypothetical protein
MQLKNIILLLPALAATILATPLPQGHIRRTEPTEDMAGGHQSYARGVPLCRIVTEETGHQSKARDNGLEPICVVPEKRDIGTEPAENHQSYARDEPTEDVKGGGHQSYARDEPIEPTENHQSYARDEPTEDVKGGGHQSYARDEPTEDMAGGHQSYARDESTEDMAGGHQSYARSEDHSSHGY